MTDVPPVAVLLVEDAADPDVDDALVARVVSVPELDEVIGFVLLRAEVEDELPDELLGEVEEANAVEDDELTDELTAPALWLASEFWMALRRLEGIQVVS